MPGDCCLSVLDESKFGEYQGFLNVIIPWARDSTNGGKIIGRQCGEEFNLHYLYIQTLLFSVAAQS